MRDKWSISKNKGRWWLIRPSNWPYAWIAEHVGTFEECCTRYKEISHGI